MATQLMTLSVLPRGKPIKHLPEETALPRAAPTSELYQTIAAASGTSIHRIRVTKGSDGQLVPNDKSIPLLQTGLLDGSKIYVKDLGPQISWKTVFLIEYLGPLVIHPLFLQFRPYIYSAPAPSFSPPSMLQSLSLLLISIHFLKREFETMFVHRFSLATMPFSNIFKNSFHYWIISGAFLAYFIYSPTGPTASEPNALVTIPGVILYLVGELGNLNSHLVLRGLRSSGGKERGIPNGLGFKWVTCPNYMFETIAWIGITMVTKNWATAVFTAVSFIQMALWGKKKERNYRREFGDKYKKKMYSVMPGLY